MGISEKFPADGSRVSGISRPPDRQNLNAGIQEKHLPKELTKLTKPSFGSFDSDHGSHISEYLSPSDPTELEERKGMTMGSVPEPYLDAWARLQCQKPAHVTVEQWRQTIDDASWFLDQWGTLAAEFRWPPGDLFDVPNDTGKCGQIWFLNGEKVRSLGPDGAYTASGRVIDKLTHCTWKNPHQKGGAQ